MTLTERRALAAKRLANPALYTRQPVQAETARNDVQADRLIDRGLVQWWA